MTNAEHTRMAVLEYAREHGREQTQRAWILSPFDTWEPNPAYRGPPVPHPESDEAQYSYQPQGD